MSAATVSWDEIASCGCKRGVLVEDDKGVVACDIEGLGRRKGGVWRAVLGSVCNDGGVCGIGVWRSGVGWDVIAFQRVV